MIERSNLVSNGNYIISPKNTTAHMHNGSVIRNHYVSPQDIFIQAAAVDANYTTTPSRDIITSPGVVTSTRVLANPTSPSSSSSSPATTSALLISPSTVATLSRSNATSTAPRSTFNYLCPICDHFCAHRPFYEPNSINRAYNNNNNITLDNFTSNSM